MARSESGMTTEMFRRAAGLILAASLVAGPAAAGSQTQPELDAAVRRLRTLQADIARKETAVAGLKTRLEQLSADVDRRRSDAAAVQRRLKDTKARLAESEREYLALRRRLGARARAIHIRGPGSLLEFLLEAASMSDLVGRVTYVARVVQHDEALALNVRRIAAGLEERRAIESRLLAESAELYRSAAKQQKALETTFILQQKELAGLSGARAELGRLVQQLQDKLRAEELARAKRVAGAGMPITFGQWAQAFLSSLGASGSRNNLVAVVAWETAEYTSATWNPLATTYPMTGATTFNSHGVRNYVSKEQGVEASILTLRRPGHGYEVIVSALMDSADPMTTAQAINASGWCRGCASGSYVVGLIPAVQAYYERYAG